MNQIFADMIRKLKIRKQANSGLGAVVNIEEASSTVVYADDLIAVLQVIDQRLAAIESKIEIE